MILAVIYFCIPVSIAEFCLSCWVIALLIHYWEGKTTALTDNSPSTPHVQITALLFYCNSVFSSWCDTELMLMVAFPCPEDRLNEMKMPFMILSNSVCVDPVKHLASSFLCFHCCNLTWIIMSQSNIFPDIFQASESSSWSWEDVLKLSGQYLCFNLFIFYLWKDFRVNQVLFVW